MATSFDIPGLRERRDETEEDREQRQRGAERDNYYTRREVMGADYLIRPSLTTQEGDPQNHPHGVPPGYQHPQRLSGWALDPDGPRILPVTQEAQHGDARNRMNEFEQAVAELGALHRILGFWDRRFEGRRYRPTNNDADLEGPQKPHDVKAWQADVPLERYLSY
jgi:hypothetical protein